LEADESIKVADYLCGGPYSCKLSNDLNNSPSIDLSGSVILHNFCLSLRKIRSEFNEFDERVCCFS